ncbi:MAG: hypothetical protein QMC67_01705 [Candidatus Wallbacteria bacterium]
MNSSYYIYLMEEIFFLILRAVFMVFGGIYFFEYIFVPAPSFFYFLILYFLFFVVLAFFFVHRPLQKSFFCRLEVYKNSFDFGKIYDEYKPAILKAVKDKAHITAKIDENYLDGNMFITFAGDYFIAYPQFFFVALAIFAAETFTMNNVSLLTANYNFGVLITADTIIFTSILLKFFRHFSPISITTHYGFTLLFAAFFSIRFLVFGVFLKNSYLLILSAVTALYSVVKYFSLKNSKAAFHVFIRLTDKNIWHMAFNYQKRIVFHRKLGFNVPMKYVETPYSTAIIYQENKENEPLKFSAPFYLGADRNQIVKSVNVFSNRVQLEEKNSAAPSSAADKKPKYDVFEKQSFGQYAAAYGREQFGVQIGLLLLSYLYCYELYKTIFMPNPNINNYYDFIISIMNKALIYLKNLN